MNGKGFSCGLCAAVALVCASLAFAEEVAPARSARVGPGTDPRAPLERRMMGGLNIVQGSLGMEF